MGLLSSDFQLYIRLDLNFRWCDAASLTGGSEKRCGTDPQGPAAISLLLFRPKGKADILGRGGGGGGV